MLLIQVLRQCLLLIVMKMKSPRSEEEKNATPQPSKQFKLDLRQLLKRNKRFRIRMNLSNRQRPPHRLQHKLPLTNNQLI